MSVALALDTVMVGVKAGVSLLALASAAFSSGEVGAFYDPSDLTSLYTSRTGGDPFQTEERRNLLLQTENMGVTPWQSGSAAPITPNYAGRRGATLVQRTIDAFQAPFQQISKSAAAQTYTISCRAKPIVGDFLSFTIQSGVGAGQRSGLCLNIAAGTVALAPTSIGSFVAGALSVSAPDADGFVDIAYTFTTDANATLSVYFSPAALARQNVDGTTVGSSPAAAVIEDLQVELGSAATPYQRVGAAYDYIGSSAGIMLDKSRMGGLSAAAFIASQPELVPAGDGDGTSIASWTTNNINAILSVTDGTFKVENGAAAEASGFYTFAATSGTTYVVEFDVRELSGCSGAMRLTTAVYLSGGTDFGLGSIGGVVGSRVRFLIRGTGTTVTLRIRTNTVTAGAFIRFTNLSVKAVPGFHAIAPSDAARPILRVSADPAIMATQPELVTNGTFDTDVSGWTASAGFAATHVSGKLRVTRATGSGAFFTGVYRTISATVDKRYVVTFNVAEVSGNTGRLRIESVLANGVPLSTGNQSVGAYEYVFTANAATLFVNIAVQSDLNSYVDYDNVSVKEIPLSAYRYYLETDGVDDWMQVLPACNLGEVFSHVGGWSRTSGAFLYTLSGTAARAAAYIDNNAVRWRNVGDTTWDVIANGSFNNPAMPAVHTQQRTAYSNIAGRVNGAAGSSISGFNNSGESQSLGLFSGRPDAFSSGLAGRFYGGVWINRAFTPLERVGFESSIARLSGIPL